MNIRFKISFAVLIIAILPVFSFAEITVPTGFVVEKISDLTGKIEAISNPAYGSGIIIANIDNGILSVLKIDFGDIDLIADMSGFSSFERVHDVKFDTTGIFSNKLFVMIAQYDISARSRLLSISPEGQIEEIFSNSRRFRYGDI